MSTAHPEDTYTELPQQYIRQTVIMEVENLQFL